MFPGLTENAAKAIRALEIEHGGVFEDAAWDIEKHLWSVLIRVGNERKYIVHFEVEDTNHPMSNNNASG